MPNTLGTLAATQVIVQEALSLIYTMRPALRYFSLGFTDKDGSPYALFNQAVVTRIITVPAVGDFKTDGSGAATLRADVDVSVTLNKFRTVWHAFLPTEYSATNRDLVRESAEPLAVALGNDMIDAIAAVWTLANYPARTPGQAGYSPDTVTNAVNATKYVHGAGWDYSTVTTLRAILNKAGVPGAGGGQRFLVINSDVNASFLNDLRIVAYLNNPKNADAITTGRLPNVAGFGLDEYPALPANGINLLGAAGTPDSTVYAQRVPKDPREMGGFNGVPIPGLMTVISDARTGLSVAMDLWVDMPTRNANFRLSWMYGTAPGAKNNIELLTSV